MTWKELATAIGRLPKEVLDREACVWIPLDWDRPYDTDEFVDVIGICAFDGHLPYSYDNFPSMNIDER